ncbi:DNA primase family protein [Chryseobacterium indologenes]|uniref:DNA primase family protein n=1 Tax=Chryseobacterium indologenes TaxID=253 RepID=UPI001626F929|nr:phage/plasmid primase, P4 family [Chryseobacterium indologenes]MBF6642811.1 DNA primase [Chryseobacterium indologenes]MEB4762366.1 phage/plasmid primase, P4 family [Chryseobacterium indologenes]QQQ69141.1 DNA primase [Chryseobacterium indologenes]
MKLSPVFNDLNDPATFINHIQELIGKRNDVVPHVEILEKLKEEFEVLDFMLPAFPQVEKLRKELEQLPRESEQAELIRKELGRLKLNQKHYLILSIENVLRLAEKNRWGLCKNHDFIYLYNSHFWNELDKEQFQKFLGEAAERMGVPKFSARFYQFREQLFKQFLSTAYLPTPESSKDKVLINLLNGTFEISPQETKLRPFERSDFMTYQLPFRYDSKAEAPLFEAYLNKVLPDQERQKVLAEYLGFVFIKHGSNALKEEKALILYGTGANGKSVFFEIVNALLGEENVSSYSLQSLTNDNGYFRAKIANKLVNYASEINGTLEASIFKQLVSGEPVEARLPYGQPFTLKQYAKLVFNCNELPKDVEHTNAYFRRFLIIPFDVTIPPEEQDKNLHTKIIENELSGVFNWVLEGLNRLLEQKRFSACEAAQKAVEKYKMESDSVQMYLSEYSYNISIKEEIPLQEMYKEYKYFCEDNGFKACSLRTLADRLRNSGYKTERKKYGTIVNAEKKDCF